MVNVYDSSLIELFHYKRIIQNTLTPFYVYQGDEILKKINFLKNDFSTKIPQELLIHYAVKANTNQSILRLVAKSGCGVEVVSGGELWRCLQADINPDQIIFSGVGKTVEELQLAIDKNIEQISVEALEELQVLASLSRPANICIRICPDVIAKTHDKITTGRLGDKFGVPLSQMREVLEVIKDHPHLNFLGFAVHVGSQISEVAVYRQTFKVLANLLKDWPESSKVKRLDLGGGFFSPYHSGQNPFDWEEYANAITEELNEFKGEVVIEPGRFLVAEAGVLFTKILYIKKTPFKTFVIVDAGMNDMMRTALYGAHHQILSCKKPLDMRVQTVDVVGPVCESSDYFGKSIQLPIDLKVGDDLVMTCTGAYGASLSSMYNSRILIPEILIENGHPYIIREAVSVQDLVKFETYKAIE
jgi:diaminopimelate decarboxylase